MLLLFILLSGTKITFLLVYTFNFSLLLKHKKQKNVPEIPECLRHPQKTTRSLRQSLWGKTCHFIFTQQTRCETGCGIWKQTPRWLGGMTTQDPHVPSAWLEVELSTKKYRKWNHMKTRFCVWLTAAFAFLLLFMREGSADLKLFCCWELDGKFHILPRNSAACSVELKQKRQRPPVSCLCAKLT